MRLQDALVLLKHGRVPIVEKFAQRNAFSKYIDDGSADEASYEKAMI